MGFAPPPHCPQGRPSCIALVTLSLSCCFTDSVRQTWREMFEPVGVSSVQTVTSFGSSWTGAVSPGGSVERGGSGGTQATSRSRATVRMTAMNGSVRQCHGRGAGNRRNAVGRIL